MFVLSEVEEGKAVFRRYGSAGMGPEQTMKVTGPCSTSRLGELGLCNLERERLLMPWEG